MTPGAERACGDRLGEQNHKWRKSNKLTWIAHSLSGSCLPPSPNGLTVICKFGAVIWRKHVNRHLSNTGLPGERMGVIQQFGGAFEGRQNQMGAF